MEEEEDDTTHTRSYILKWARRQTQRVKEVKGGVLWLMQIWVLLAQASINWDIQRDKGSKRCIRNCEMTKSIKTEKGDI